MYLVDSNIIINSFDVYPPDIFPGYWDTFNSYVSHGHFKFHEKVCDEIDARNDAKSSWLQSHVPLRSRLQVTNEELTEYKALTTWVAQSNPRNYTQAAIKQFLHVADSWIVASAIANNCAILSNETSSSTTKRVKIPDAAAAFNVKCVNALNFWRDQSITF